MENIIQLNEGEIKSRLSTLVRETVEETLNKLLDEEADRITNAHRYEPECGASGYARRPLQAKNANQ